MAIVEETHKVHKTVVTDKNAVNDVTDENVSTSKSVAKYAV